VIGKKIVQLGAYIVEEKNTKDEAQELKNKMAAEVENTGNEKSAQRRVERTKSGADVMIF
jgi:hypothetical protein